MSDKEIISFNIPDISEVEFTLKVLPEDTPYIGNVVCSGDDNEDKEIENWVERELKAGNGCAWCCVEVSVTWKNIREEAHRGCCSYESYTKLEEDIFINNSENLKEEAYGFLVERLRNLAK